MTHRIRPGGPNGANRPFIPLPADHPQDQMAQALDHIAVVLSSIDSHRQPCVSSCEDWYYVTELCGPLHDAQLQMVEFDRA